MRQIERQVMLRIIDQRWREHLYEMDYLKEGIHLRAMGQKDPLIEWQREGFEMFGTMMNSIAQDFVRYVTHIQVNEQTEGQAEGAALTAPDDPKEASNVEYSGPDADADGSASMKAAATATAAAAGAPAVVDEVAAVPRTPVVKTEFEKTPRNALCPCGSGKKFKLCHGA